MLLFYLKKNCEFSYFSLPHFSSSNFIVVVLQKACPTIKLRIIEHHAGLTLKKMEIFHQIFS
jgi:hypothetical protein